MYEWTKKLILKILISIPEDVYYTRFYIILFVSVIVLFSF